MLWNSTGFTVSLRRRFTMQHHHQILRRIFKSNFAWNFTNQSYITTFPRRMATKFKKKWIVRNCNKNLQSNFMNASKSQHRFVALIWYWLLLQNIKHVNMSSSNLTCIICGVWRRHGRAFPQKKFAKTIYISCVATIVTLTAQKAEQEQMLCNYTNVTHILRHGTFTVPNV